MMMGLPTCQYIFNESDYLISSGQQRKNRQAILIVFGLLYYYKSS